MTNLGVRRCQLDSIFCAQQAFKLRTLIHNYFSAFRSSDFFNFINFKLYPLAKGISSIFKIIKLRGLSNYFLSQFFILKSQLLKCETISETEDNSILKIYHLVLQISYKSGMRTRQSSDRDLYSQFKIAAIGIESSAAES